MNITLSADEKLIEKGREYARKHNTSLNNLIRDYLKTISDETDLAAVAREFSEIALTRGGRSEEGFKFNRDAVYDRKGQR